jgi:hypothetical protein
LQSTYLWIPSQANPRNSSDEAEGRHELFTGRGRR